MYQKRYVKKSFETSSLNELANERSTLEAKKKVLNAKVDLKMFFFLLQNFQISHLLKHYVSLGKPIELCDASLSFMRGTFGFLGFGRM